MRHWLEALGLMRSLMATGGDLRVDARRVRPGDVFVALPGLHTHGDAYLEQAAQAGAIAAISNRPAANAPLEVLVLSDLEAALWPLACERYPLDWTRLRVVAVTGTNGKTSVTHMLAYAAERMGWSAATIGTVAYAGPGYSEPARETTPHFVEILRLLHTWQRQAPRLLLAIEASSHALAQGRLGMLPVDVAVLTNLTADHLDYHGDMAAYGAAKARLHAQPRGCGSFASVLPATLAEHVRVAAAAGRTVWRFGSGGELDVVDVQLQPTATQARYTFAGAICELELAAAGSFQADNAAAAMLALLALGVPLPGAAAALEGWRAAPGRLELVTSQPVVTYVDYAHTPDALARTLSSVRALTQGRVLLVFGAGGNRDPHKRPVMGRLAEELADVVFVTSDNPRSEDPQAIIAAILAGMAAPERARVEPDRARAIAAAVAAARPGDAVVVAGKGHEAEQVFADRRIAFDDRAELLKAVRS